MSIPEVAETVCTTSVVDSAGVQPPDGAMLLDELHTVISDYVVLTSPEAVDGVVLWIAMTHAVSAFDSAPRLAISSPMPACGKSRLLEVIEGTVRDPIPTVQAKVAAIFRSITNDDPPTLLIDEADTIWGKRGDDAAEDLRALLNAGFQRGKTILRCVGNDNTVAKFPTFAPAALAGIGKLPDTITTRAVNISMRARAEHETIQPFRARRDLPRLHAIRDKLSEWAVRNLGDMGSYYPEMPLEDRPADTWEPLIIVADTAGGDWPQRARQAAITLTNQAKNDDGNIARRLLADLRTIFQTDGRPFIPTGEILRALIELPDSTWGEQRLSPHALARYLKPFEIRSASTGSIRGYKPADFTDTFTRYLPPQNPDPGG